MKALRFEQFGPPSVLQFVDIPAASATRHEAVVRVYAAGLNPSDVKNVAGAMHSTVPPRTPGRDYAGVVAEGPKEWVGKEVWGSSGELGFTVDGSHAEFVAVPVASLQQKPQTLSMAQAASVGVPYVTAYLSLIERAKLRAGETLLIVGGTGAVGTAAAQIARWSGARVIATVRSDEFSADWRGGVDDVIDLRMSDLVEMTKALTDGRGADVVLNTVGQGTFAASVTALAKGGRLTAISTLPQKIVSFDLLDLYRRELEIYGVNSLAIGSTDTSKILAKLSPGFESGALHVSEPVMFALSDGIAAYEAVDAGKSGKVVLTI